MILHRLPPDSLAPTGLNLIRFGPDLLHFLADQGFCGLVGLPLLDGAHTLGVELVHSPRFLLDVGDEGDVRDTALHEGLGEGAGGAGCCVGGVGGGFAGLPACLDAFFFDFVVFVDCGWQFDVELLLLFLFGVVFIHFLCRFLALRLKLYF